ncbi:MAG: DMT family transporter [Aestuariibacter sp.]
MLGTTLFSFKSIVIKLAFDYQLDAEQVIVLRMLFAAPIYSILLIWYLHKKPVPASRVFGNFWTVLVSGVLGYYLASLLDMKGLEYISAQLERLILYTYPGFVMLFSWIVWRVLPGRRTILAMLITYFGIVIVLGFEVQLIGADALLGAFYILISAAAFGVYLVLSKQGIAAMGSQVFTCLAMLIATVCVLLHLLVLQATEIFSLPIMAYAWVLVLVIFCTVIPSLLIAAAIARLGPQQTSILGGLGPVMTAGFAVVILSEPFGLNHALGTLCVITGVWLIATEKNKAD